MFTYNIIDLDNRYYQMLICITCTITCIKQQQYTHTEKQTQIKVRATNLHTNRKWHLMLWMS